jgi:hypothetical protein
VVGARIGTGASGSIILNVCVFDLMWSDTDFAC